MKKSIDQISDEGRVIKDLRSENCKLKQRVAALQKELEFHTKIDHETTKLSNWLSLTHYDDGRYIITGPIVKSSFNIYEEDLLFIHDSQVKCGIEQAAFQTKTLFVKNAIRWMTETEYPHVFGNINFFISDLIPVTSVIINPKLKFALESSVFTSGDGGLDIESKLKNIVRGAEYER